MAEPRPPIPLPIQRDVRQRCGFGCVICGCPLYEYHHMVPYHESKQHVPDELTLLCDKHHKEATNSLLTDDQIQSADSNPFNAQHGVSSPYGLNFQGEAFTCVIGDNRFTGAIRDEHNVAALIPISIDDIDLIWFAIAPNGSLFLNANIFDECNLPLLTIVGNCLVYRTETWDIDFQGNTLTVREAARKIFFEITFEPPNQITVNRARLLCNGVEIIVRQSHIFVANSGNLFVRNRIDNCAIGIQIGRNQRGLGAGMLVNPEIVSRYFMTTKELRDRERKAKDDMDKMLSEFGINLDDVT